MANLIVYTDIHTVCGVNSLVEERKLKVWITEAHVIWRKILGKALYDLQQATPAEARFVDLMADEKGWGKSYLCWKALELAYPTLLAEADRGGVFVKEEPGVMKAVDSRTLSMIKGVASGAAETREQMLMKYLRDNLATYPEWETVTGSEDRITEENSRNTLGVSFRKAKAQTPYRG